MNAQALLALQLVDSQLDQLAAERKRLPEHAALSAATARQTAWQTEDARLRARLIAAVAEIAEAERQGSELTTKRNRLEGQLRTVTNERQADALTHEIDAIRQHQSDLDDRELAAMETQSETEAALATLAGEHDDVAASLETAAADLDRALERVGTDEAALRRQREQAQAALTADERALYDAQRARFGGVGIAQLEGRRCSGCHLDLSAAESEAVRTAPADELPECPHCGRLLAR